MNQPKQQADQLSGGVKEEKPGTSASAPGSGRQQAGTSAEVMDTDRQEPGTSTEPQPGTSTAQSDEYVLYHTVL